MDYILLKDYPYEVHADGTVYRTERKSSFTRCACCTADTRGLPCACCFRRFRRFCILRLLLSPRNTALSFFGRRCRPLGQIKPK